MRSNPERIAEVEALIERVRAASSANYAVEQEIGHTLVEPNPYIIHPNYTASIDAALALAERILPGWRWVVHSPRSGLAYGASLSDPSRGGRIVPAEHPASAPLAILLATLTTHLTILKQGEAAHADE